MAAFRPWLLCIISSFLLAHLQGSVAEEDAFALAKQWETYATGMSERLSEEQVKSEKLRADIEKYYARVNYLEEELKAKEKGVEEKEEEIRSLKSQLKSTAKLDVKSLEESLEKEKSKVKELSEVNKKQKEELKSVKGEAATKKAQEAELLKLQSRNTILKSELIAAEKAAAKYNECHITLLEKEEIILSTRKEILQKDEEIAQLSLELGQLSGQTFPPWILKHYSVLKSHSHYHWKTYGEPASSHAKKTISTAATDFGTWVTPHITTARTVIKKAAVSAKEAVKPVTDFTTKEVSPFVEKHWTKAKTVLSPHVETLKYHSKKGYKWALDKTSPYYIHVTETYGPHVTLAMDYAKPHVEKVRRVTDPYVSWYNSQAQRMHKDIKFGLTALVQNLGISLEDRVLSILAMFLFALPLLLAHLFTRKVVGPKKKRAGGQEKGTNGQKRIKKPRRDQ